MVPARTNAISTKQVRLRSHPIKHPLTKPGNAAINFVPLTVANNVPGTNGLSQAKEQDFTINVQMPQNFNCIGGTQTPLSPVQL